MGADGALDAAGRLLEKSVFEDEGNNRLLQEEEVPEVKKSDLKTGKWLNFEIGVKEYDLDFDAAKGIFWVVNDEFGLDAAKFGKLEASGVDITVFAFDQSFSFRIMLLTMFAFFNI